MNVKGTITNDHNLTGRNRTLFVQLSPQTIVGRGKMPGYNRKGTAPKMSDAIRAQLAQTLKAIRKDEVPVYRGNERAPIASIRRAYATLTLHGVGVVNRARVAWLLEGEVAALRFLKGNLAGYLLAQPLDKYDQYDPEQAELVWDADMKGAHVDLLYILQRLNKVVAPGFVSEVPLSLEALPGHQFPYICFHLNSAELRVEKEGPTRSKPEEDDSENEGEGESEAKADASEKKMEAAKKGSASKKSTDGAKRTASKKETAGKKGTSDTGDVSVNTKETASAKAPEEEAQ
jgi:hypothetical protein